MDVYACMHVCLHGCMYVCMDVCMHACMYECMYVCMHACMYTGCPRRKVKYFGSVFLMLNYTDITQNTYIQS